MSKVNPLSFLVAFLLYNMSQLLSSLRLFTLMSCGHKVSRWLMTKIYYRSMFFSALLPFSLGADAYKVWLFVKKLGLSLKRSSFIVIWERVIGVCALLSIIVFLWNIEWEIGDYVALPLSLFSLFFLISGVYLVLPDVLNGIDLRSNVNAFITSLAIHLCQISCYMLLASALLDSSSLVKAAILFLVSSLGAFVPISFSGLGAREAVFVLGGKYLGMNVDALVAVSLMFQIIHFSTAALGAFVNLDLSPKDFKVSND